MVAVLDLVLLQLLPAAPLAGSRSSPGWKPTDCCPILLGAVMALIDVFRMSPKMKQYRAGTFECMPAQALKNVP